MPSPAHTYEEARRPARQRLPRLVFDCIDGGRQLDASPLPILQLRAIRQALGPGFPLFYDTGLRCGEDVVKACALGAE